MEKADLIKQFNKQKLYRKLALYRPYGHPDTLNPEWLVNTFGSGCNLNWSKKPWQLDFHNTKARERMLMAANRVGKTESAAAEVAIHATGNYPDWWQGFKFTKPVLIWVGSDTNEASRQITQKALLGGLGDQLGTGYLPIESFAEKPKMRQAGVGDVVDFLKIRHASGGVSIIVFKTYEQGWRKWQGTAPHVIWLDEEPQDYRLFTECQTRIITSRGILLVTFTPLEGETELVLHFQQGLPGTYVETATWEDAPHLTQQQRDEIITSYPDYERQARSQGIPMMGEGRVFKINEEEILCDPFDLNQFPWYSRIAGVDFGIDHPAAGCWLAYDRDNDIVYIYDCYRQSDQTPLYHARQLKTRGDWIPVMWPHDGTQRKNDGKQIRNLYAAEGANMFDIQAHYRPKPGEKPKMGSQSVEPIIMEMDERMRTGRLKVFRHLYQWREEFRSLHRKDNKIVARKDDVFKASCYALMMLRYAVAPMEIQRDMREVGGYRAPIIR